MTEAAQAALARLAPLMRGLRASPDATISYDVLSDALIWSDECPALRVLRTINGWQVLRYVFHFRTQLILGRPEEREPDPEGYARQIFGESQAAWNEARRLFPEWPGFDFRRCSVDLRRVYESLSAESRRELKRSSESLMQAAPGRKETFIDETCRSTPVEAPAMRLPRVRFTVRRTLAALLFAGVVLGGWFVYSMASISLGAERTLHATLFTIRLVERFVSETGRWPHSWVELEGLSTPDTLFGQRWPAASPYVRERVVVEFDSDPREMAWQDSMRFTAIRPIGPHYEYRDYGDVPSLQSAIRKSILDPPEPKR